MEGNMLNVLRPVLLLLLLSTLPSWSLTRVLLPSVACVNRTRLSWIQKQRKVLGKLYSSIRAWRHGSSHSRVDTVPSGDGRGCVLGLCHREGKWTEFLPGGHSCAAQAPESSAWCSDSAHSPPPPS